MTGTDIAIVGMAGRFPGAVDVDGFWRNLRQGTESISTWPRAESERSPLDSDLFLDANLVAAAGVLENVDGFDAGFFGLTPSQAMLMDPQHRVFLECAWEAMEASGFDPEQFGRSIGVYASATVSRYLYLCLSNPALVASSGLDLISMGNNLDFMTTLVSYKLNLTGPSYAVQTACSSSLVAVHVAVQALLAHECEMALAGGVSVRIPQRTGYRHQEGGIVSPDGHCRPFDADARGTVFGNGAGVVVLQRLEDAVKHRSTIHAVIKGSAVNNDGSGKAGFTAPSVSGQSAVILEAQANAAVPPDTIGYVEAHGTGTSVGDPIEVTALTEAFRRNTGRAGFCALGSVKSNVGHLDAAAGVVGLIKTVLMLQHREIPPTLHFRRPNPRIDFERSPFYVNRELRPWECDGVRRAGVSSFGIGGTNAHVIVEEAPATAAGAGARHCQVLTVSAHTPEALEQATNNLAARAATLDRESVADAAYTGQVGRKAFRYRRALVRGPGVEAAPWTVTHQAAETPPAVVLLFPGQGAQLAGAGMELYRSERVYREEIERCLAGLRRSGGSSREWERALLGGTGSEELLRQTRVAQPALFAVEYALARLWMAWGVEPQAMLGHSLGEYVAASLSGIFELDDALALVAERGALMQETERGKMLAIGLAEGELQEWIGPDLDLAAVNAARSCVVAGRSDAIDAVVARLDAAGVWRQELEVTHAFHSRLMNSVLTRYEAAVDRRPRHPMRIPVMSNVTGRWLTDGEARSAAYWARQLREPVRFAAALEALGRERVFLEVGPAQTLRGLASGAGFPATSSMPARGGSRTEMEQLLGAVGELWTLGVPIDWEAFYAGQRRQRVPLPSYPFERRRCWLPAPAAPVAKTMSAPAIPAKQDLDDWFYVPSWKRSPKPRVTVDGFGKNGWLVFLDEQGLGEELARTLERSEHQVIRVRPGAEFLAGDDGTYTIRPQCAPDYEALVASIARRGPGFPHVLHCWGTADRSPDDDVRVGIDRSFFTLLWLARAVDQHSTGAGVRLYVITSDAHDVVGHEDARPVAAMASGPSMVIPQECAGFQCRHIDLPRLEPPASVCTWARAVLAEVSAGTGPPLVAYRAHHRWLPSFERTSPRSMAESAPALRHRGVYLILGGLGRFGLVIANYLAREAKARLVLTSRSRFPERTTWREWVDTHPRDDVTSRRIGGLESILAAGGEVRVVKANAAREDEMTDLIGGIERDLGPLNGVIHAAGHTGMDTHRAIHEITREDCDEVFAAKVVGLDVLARALARARPDFCLLTSSLSPILGGLGLAAYAAAHHYMDAFAERMHRRSLPWMSVNWEGWARDRSQMLGGGPGRSITDLTMSEAEIERCFDLVLRIRDVPRIVIATADLQPRIRAWVDDVALAAASTDGPASARARGPEPRSPDGPNPRQDGDVSVEEILAIAASILGVTDLGAHDNLFDRGANSLMAVQLLSRLRRDLQRAIPLADVFANPSAAALADAINSVQKASEHPGDLERVLGEIEAMSQDEARALLRSSLAPTEARDEDG